MGYDPYVAASTGMANEMREAYAAYQGGDFLDIGAYHGWYSVLLAPKARKGDAFVSFEPDPQAVPELLSDLAIIARFFPDVSYWTVPKPLGNGAGLDISRPDGPTGHLRVASTRAAADSDNSEDGTLTVDALVHALGLRPAFAKIDVEGAECFVLQGMQQTLKDHHPTLMLEVHPKWQPQGVTIDDVRDLVKRHGYTVTDLDVTEVAIRQLWT